MKTANPIRAIASVLLLSATFAATPVGAQVASGPKRSLPNHYDFTPITNLIRNAVNTLPLRGASLLLIKDGRVVYKQAFGTYTLGTRVPIASATKWLSASVLMTLVDDGTVRLDDPVARYLPSFTGLKGTMTIRQLLSHTSGLPGQDVGCLGNTATTLAQCVNYMASPQVSLLGTPGTLFAYGGNSFQVAGRIAEVATGKSWDQLFLERIAEPLQMTSTDYGFPSTAPGYVFATNPRLAGGVRSTLDDYGNLVRMHLDGGVFNGNRVLSLAAVREMQRKQSAGTTIVNSPNPTADGYGLGEWRDLVDAPGNAIQLSSQGAFGFSPWIDTRRNLAGVFLVQDQLRDVSGLVNQMQQQIRDILDAAPDTAPTAVK